MARPWEWEATTYDYLSKRKAQDRLQRELVKAAQSGKRTLIEALMGMGKTHSTGRLAAHAGLPVTALSHKRSTRAQLKAHARDEGLSVYELMVFNRDCPTAAGEYGDEWQTAVESLQRRGLTAGQIHVWAEPPCQEEGRCPYTAGCDFDSKEYDLLIGHPVHAHVEHYIERRVVVFDEDSGSAFEDEVSSGHLQETLSHYLSTTDTIGADHLDDLRAMRKFGGLRPGVAELVEELGPNNPTLAIDNPKGRADVGVLIAGVTLGEDVGEGTETGRVNLERYTMASDGDPEITTLYDLSDGSLVIRRPPALGTARAVLALDGTPTKEIWSGRLGTDLSHTRVLSDSERREYISKALGYTIYQTTDSTKPVTSGEYAKEDELDALLHAVCQRHGKPHVISSKKVLNNGYVSSKHAYARPSLNHGLHFGNIRSENILSGEELLVVYGSHHPGDRYIQRLAALDGVAITSTGKGSEKTYGREGDKYYRYAVHNEVAQAIFRVGRDGSTKGATIYVHTSLLPEWVPSTRVQGLRKRAPNEQAVRQYLREVEIDSTKGIAEETGQGTRNVRKVLKKLRNEGVVETEGRGPSTRHIDSGLSTVHPKYEVSFVPHDPQALTKMLEHGTEESARSD